MAQAPTSPQGDADPSMDDILASIRRILSDEEKAAKAQRPDDGVLMLDPSMMIDDTTPMENLPHQPEAQPASAAEPHAPQHDPADPPTHLTISGNGPPALPALPAPEPSYAAAPQYVPPAEVPAAAETLVAPEAAAMAASSVGALMRTLLAERTAVVHRGGPSIEDVVREEIRPLLKQWLDTHLPPLVERLVRTEIERVVGRIGS